MWLAELMEGKKRYDLPIWLLVTPCVQTSAKARAGVLRRCSIPSSFSKRCGVRTAVVVVGTIWLPAPQETAALVKSSLESLARPANYLFCIWASDSHASDCATLRKMGAAKKVPKAAPDPKATLAKSKADAQGFKCVKCMQVCHRPCCHADCHALITLSYHTSRCTSKQAPPASPCPHLLGHAFL